jgi:hypothetical protein
MTHHLLTSVRNTPPATADHLWHWVRAYTGVAIARAPVCRGHRPPFDWFAAAVLDRPPLALVLGPRGGGKSFLSAIATHVESRFTPRLRTRILGGSRAQSSQILEAIRRAIVEGGGPGGHDRDTIEELLKESVRYRNGSHVDLLAASSKSVRGPHVPSLKLDEVDEIDPEIRESAMGMNMAVAGVTASAILTSTWHRVGGPMAGLIEQGISGAFPVHASCTFEVLQRCDAARSGPWVGGEAGYERCPACPLQPWCHAERDRNGNRPLAKLADGHYAIDSLIQKVGSVSKRVFESDYLCLGPKADGVWFKGIDEPRVYREAGEYDPRLPVVLAIDSGVFTGAVAFQHCLSPQGQPLVNVFWDYLAEGLTARVNAKAIVAGLAGRHGTKRKVVTDPAGGARNAVGPTVLAEYQAEGLKADGWPGGSVSDGLALLEALLCPADGPPRLLIHPRCKHLRTALQHYLRAKLAGQWQDYPKDPQHPFEDLVDALRGGLKNEFPDGLGKPTEWRRARAAGLRN